MEVIKGVASALYGASALGGVINLVSRRPRESEHELLANLTSLGGSDVTAWIARAPSGERRVGRVRVFLNAENVFGVRQTNDDPLAQPARRADGRWTVDAWAPLDGRVFNGGLRVAF